MRYISYWSMLGRWRRIKNNCKFYQLGEYNHPTWAHALHNSYEIFRVYWQFYVTVMYLIWFILLNIYTVDQIQNRDVQKWYGSPLSTRWIWQGLGIDTLVRAEKAFIVLHHWFCYRMSIQNCKKTYANAGVFFRRSNRTWSNSWK